MSPRLQEELLQQVSLLPEKEQRRVLAFAKDLGLVAGGIAGKDLLKFSGTIDQADLQAMEKAIEEGCERVDRSDW